ncbi:N-acetyl-1-D-myo-inositol-2-amino-2-deoxy-alpha-D-glucopyranoside deacetylase [Corynebacterium sp. zg912]|uniref:1D-myo-inositol 2-acetamido-2-deoxy-alpha-D-glucopyranoside deacetylase n=1 Tax=Corynebacterium wankanglinii TaxID=2735136 RepID=A0A7H0KBZ9_9CORY|nr:MULTISPECIES: N-acetyl-1-D-myo-inositol-2-amino-2-deoxy-alpha-D-glucopyranoside deacetylase [Corynebacterium]MBA1837667.1 N-acetyl-1-D-myo-inositol-2-amino-2-deoxy-alpha-D-glucopyranoside deacetylase [Corynebacterium wankanglinii]MCR5928877.1 N-acetyl-1-D-myo-inositol-2-amino-2-deoxy-alpha-D-glucopyranoside deacetylase [Corynebacterium sp. zg912]QNP94815.1 N-acetyl-1-D-myo-inositol-2-amino-2-deoxy-alpha-D-glucopyranoside deacetylase [Corynebacterium wankanglinii]
MTARDLAGYRVVAVHAHPDDEAITTGGAIADLAKRGADVLVVTCTLGEEGEVIGEPYQHLVVDEADQLGGFRIQELQRSLAALGARGQFLGGAGRFRDSGMEGSPASRNPRAFVNSGEAGVDTLAAIFEAERPHLVLTYGPDGGYGHPDHIRAHEITHAAAKRVGIPRILWAVRLATETASLMPAEAPAGWRLPQDGELDGVEASDIRVELDEAAYSAKVEAMRAHATQLWIADGRTTDVNPHAALASGPVVYYALSNLIVQPIQRVEHYQLGAGLPLDDAASLLTGIDL